MASAQEYLLSDTSLSIQPYTDSFELYDGIPDSLFYTRELWGCIPVASITVTSNGRRKRASMFYGASSHQYRDACLYVSDHGGPLSVTGNTHIEGNAYLPKSGLRSGFGQQDFSGKNFIDGEIAVSSKTLPPINSALNENIKYLATLIEDTLQKFERLSSDSLSQSFFSAARFIKLNKLGLIGERKISGKLMLVSDSVIEVSPTADIEDVVLIAPYIRFKQGFKGSVQAFALDSITVEGQCYLYYPSSIAGIGRNNKAGSTGAIISMKEDAIIEGLVLGLKPELTSNIKPVVRVDKQAVVKGLVYNAGFTYLNGKVEGAVFTDFFLEQQGSMSIENTLTDVTIVQSRWFTVANYFSLFHHAYHPKIIKWFY